jgi:hypothetical protein
MWSIQTWLLVYATLCMIAKHMALGQSLNQSEALFDNMLVGYHKFIRPLQDQSLAVRVNVSLLLSAIYGFNSVTGELIAPGVLMCTWNDERLGWDPSTNGGIQSVVVPQYSIWKPMVVIGNHSRKISAFGHDQDDFVYARVMHDGTVTWNPAIIMYIACSIDVTYFPFDTQTCSFWFTPWGYLIIEVYLSPSHANMDVTFLETNSEWIVKEASSFQGELIGASHAGYTIKLERRPAYYLVNLILPYYIFGFPERSRVSTPCRIGRESFVFDHRSSVHCGFYDDCWRHNATRLGENVRDILLPADYYYIQLADYPRNHHHFPNPPQAKRCTHAKMARLYYEAIHMEKTEQGMFADVSCPPEYNTGSFRDE